MTPTMRFSLRNLTIAYCQAICGFGIALGAASLTILDFIPPATGPALFTAAALTACGFAVPSPTTRRPALCFSYLFLLYGAFYWWLQSK
jgi:hypothetical protein